HPDLKAVAAGGRLLPGYCFISDSFVNNGGTCLGGTISDAEASDPGDWITSSDLTKSECKDAQVEPSSWHGTRTAGILGALTNNSAGVAATTWQGQILPVRVLGKCGGSDSDIIMGMLWAAGISVSDAPTNPTPAKVINMSLGGTGACPSYYQDAINQITALGVLVVVSAGNENGPVDTPANCPGVAGIAGLRHVGTKVGYSSFGAEVALSAPAGNCVNTGSTQPCLYPITTTTNLSTTTPDANAEDYTGEYACGGTSTSPTSYPGCTIGANQYRTPNLGTSFSAPIVSGIAALMAATNSHLNACQLISRLKEGAAPFPQTSAGATTQPPVCPQFDPTSQECICPQNGSQCGTGIANAPGALTAASRPVAVIALPASVAAGQSVALNAAGSVAANSRTLSSYQWSSPTLALQGASTSTVTATAPSCGFGTVHLVVTDNAGQSDAADVVLSTTDATSTAPATAAATSCSGALAPKLAVCPSSASVQTGGNQSFTASFANLSNQQVTWEVNGVAGGNATVGTVTSSGVYTAPANVPTPATVKVEAVSVANNTVQNSTTVTITAPPSSHGGGGSLDLLTLLLESLALGAGLSARFYARRWAASSQLFCARR
ncbi:MAG: S8 family serine peptidase, partial [Sinobacteraceae bacterium]|nr:S8 family serine peptidase [Nevskiaceae bacterium]